MNRQALVAQLSGEEGRRRVVYDDATGKPILPGSICKGHPTIGVGRALDVHGISAGEAERLKYNDTRAGRGPSGSASFLCYDGATHLPVKPGTVVKGAVMIGYGRNLCTVGLLDEEIDLFLTNDIILTEASVLKALPWYANQTDGRQQALVDLAFNMGLTHLLGFKASLGLMQNGKYAQASEGFRHSAWATQVQPARVDNICNLILKG